MNSTITKNEKKFFDALNDIFVGAKIEGKGGYINLMNIKSKYYKEHIYGAIYNFIEDGKFSKNNSNREELFARLYTFFNRYFNETGSIYFQYTPLKENVYERVYSNKEDVSLFYKTHMLYYVKSERIFKSMDLKVEDEDKVGDFHFNFDVSQLELAKNNEKKEIVFSFDKVEKKKVYLNVLYSSSGNKTKLDEILKAIKKEDESLKLDESLLNKALQTYKKQAEVDFFINKNAKKFLKDQFNLWYYQYYFSDDINNEFNKSDFDDRRIRELQWTKEIAYKIIDFISQFEDELVKVWNKPKFVRNSNYVLTLDKLENNIDLINKIISHKNFKEQENEWKELGYNLENYSKDKIISLKSLNEDFKYLTIDTKYFEDIKYEILDIFENLDDELNGILINSDNYQALNTLGNKLKSKVNTVYIDPPYNTGGDDFSYKDFYKHSSWLTMMENRLTKTKSLLSKKGILISSIGRQEQERLQMLCNSIFPYDDDRDKLQVSWQTAFGGGQSNKNNYENILFYTNSGKFSFDGVKNQERQIRIIHGWKEDINAKVSFSIRLNYSLIKKKLYIIVKDKVNDEKIKVYFYDKEQFINDLSKLGLSSLKDFDKIISCFISYNEKLEGEIVSREFGKSKYYIYRGLDEGYLYETVIGKKVNSILNKDEKLFSNILHGDKYKNIYSSIGRNELYSLVGVDDFETVKPEQLLNELLGLNISQGPILDFFAGSGTSLSVAHKSGLKWYGVEMGEYFKTIIIPRLKKVLNGEQGGVSNENNWEGGGFFKYYGLEQYEEALEKVKYSENTIFIEEENKDIFSNYVFLKDEKFTKAIELDLENGKTKIDLSKIYDDIDIGETLSNITGKKIKKIKADSVILEEIGEIKFDNIPLELVKPLIWWK
ncbi:MAG: site-specific DNA-methyltransferase [Candidatus Gracilibacteria bacterium]|nr:site-specific DNA-methyltransferase [Candidatus Gracilibacteria bacterium]